MRPRRLLLGLLLWGGSVHGEGRPPYGGRLVAPLGSTVRSLDPAAAELPGELTLAQLLFETPFTVDGAGRVRPQLIARIEPGEGTRVRLILRPGLTFHDGRRLLAGDVAASLNRALRQVTAWPLAPLKSARAVDEGTVEVELSRAAPDLPWLLASPVAAVTPAGQTPGRTAVGSGPFRLLAWEKRSLRLAANPRCSSGRPYLDEVSLRLFASRTEEAGSYEVGSSQLSLHGATAFEGGAPKHPTAILDGPRTVALALAFGRGTQLPGAAATATLPGEVNFRRLLGAAIDRERLRRLAVHEPAQVVATLIPGGARSVGERPKATAELGRLLGGARLHAALLIEGARFHQREVAEQLLAELGELGVEVTIDVADGRSFHQRLAEGRFDLALVEAGALGGLEQPALAALGLLATVDPRTARALLARAPAELATVEKVVAERLPFTPLLLRQQRLHHRADLRGLAIDGLGRVGLADAFVGR